MDKARSSSQVSGAILACSGFGGSTLRPAELPAGAGVEASGEAAASKSGCASPKPIYPASSYWTCPLACTALVAITKALPELVTNQGIPVLGKTRGTPATIVSTPVKA